MLSLWVVPGPREEAVMAGWRRARPNQAYREELAGHGECRDCEAPLLAGERGRSRCAPAAVSPIPAAPLTTNCGRERETGPPRPPKATRSTRGVNP